MCNAWVAILPTKQVCSAKASTQPSHLLSIFQTAEAWFEKLVSFASQKVMVGDEGLEPPTSSLSVTRSNQLS
jgi:hypothetical protein